MTNKFLFTILVVCIGVSVAENVFLRRRDAARQPSKPLSLRRESNVNKNRINVRRGYPSNYPYGWPKNIPSGGDYIANNAFSSAGYLGFTHDPCLDYAYNTVKQYLIALPSAYNTFNNLYLMCTNNQGATLYMCPPGQTFYSGHCH